MLRLFAAVVLLAAGPVASRADSPAPPRKIEFRPAGSSNVVFVMLPPQRDASREIVAGPEGILYRIQPDGTRQEVYRTKGWYAFQVFVSADGRYLVQMGAWPVGRGPSREHVAVAFHRDGQLLKSYSTAELVKDPTKVRRSVSHYFWQATLPPGTAPLDRENRFRLGTIDGWIYVFDVTTGAVVSMTRNPAIP